VDSDQQVVNKELLLSVRRDGEETSRQYHPGGNTGANLKSTSHRCYLWEVVFEWELTEETIYLPLNCLQGGWRGDRSSSRATASHVLPWLLRSIAVSYKTVKAIAVSYKTVNATYKTVKAI